MARHYYRCDIASETGKQLRKLLNDCQKAEQAQMDFGRKCGAQSIVPVNGAFEGGVVGVVFKDDDKVNRAVWREIVKDEKDGKIIWRPNCEHREGAVIAKNDRYRPSNTSTKIYSYGQRTWQEVKHIYTAEQWFHVARLFMSGKELQDKWEKDDKMVDEILSKKRFVKYVEIYRKDTTRPVREMSKLQREAISLEHQRIMLPVVTPQRVFATLKADMMAGAKDNEQTRIIRPETPTFWEYGGWWYVGCDYPCKSDGLEEISSEAYVSKRTDLIRMQRDMEAIAANDAAIKN